MNKDTLVIVACGVAIIPIIFCAVYFSMINVEVHNMPGCFGDPKFMKYLQPPITRGLFASIITGVILLGLGILLIYLKARAPPEASLFGPTR